MSKLEENLKTPNQLSISEILWYMQDAEKLADLAWAQQEVPVGAIILNQEQRVIARTYNDKEQTNKATGHAEITAINEATKAYNDWRLEGSTLIVTLEPCLMCMGAIIQSRIQRLIFGAYDPKGGAISLGYNMHQDSRLNHKVEVIGGVRQFENSRKLSRFFKEKRRNFVK